MAGEESMTSTASLDVFNPPQKESPVRINF